MLKRKIWVKEWWCRRETVGIYKGAQLGGEKEALPALYLKIDKIPLILEKRALIEKTPNFFLAFFLYILTKCFRRTLILRNLAHPEKFLIVRLK